MHYYNFDVERSNIGDIDMKRQLFIIISLFWFTQYAYIPYQTPFLSTLGATSEFIGVIVGCYGISQIVFRIPVGIMADSGEFPKPFIVGGFAITFLASSIRFIFCNPNGFLIANFFSGLSCSTWISFIVLFMSLFPLNQQKKASSIATCAQNIGILSAFITGMLVFPILGMKTICLMCIITAIVGTILCCLLPVNCSLHTSALYVVPSAAKHSRKANGNLLKSKLLTVFLNKRLLFFSLLAMIQQGVQASTTMSFTTQIIRNLGASSLIVGLSSVIYMFSSVLCSIFASSQLAAKISIKIWIPFSFGVSVLYCFLVPRSSSIVSLCFLQVLPGLSTGLLLSYLTAEAISGVSNSIKSTTMGVFQSIYAIGLTFFPIAAGLLAEYISIRAAYYCLAFSCIVACVASVAGTIHNVKIY